MRPDGLQKKIFLGTGDARRIITAETGRRVFDSVNAEGAFHYDNSLLVIVL